MPEKEIIIELALLGCIVDIGNLRILTQSSQNRPLVVLIKVIGNLDRYYHTLTQRLSSIDRRQGDIAHGTENEKYQCDTDC